MKKIVLSFAVIAALMVTSCKEKTQEEVGEATEAMAEDVATTVDSAAAKVDSAATAAANP